MGEVILKMSNICKTFGGVYALSHVDFELRKGEILALVGENGAGKSTLMKILLGIHKRDLGSIMFQGQEAHFDSPSAALRAGISMVHQEISLIQEMDVAENIWLGREDRFIVCGVISTKKRYEASDRILKELSINVSPRAKIKDLSVAQMQLVELVRAVSYEPSIIIMDEPTSALTNQEIDLLYTIVRKLRDQGVAIIFISHKIEEIFEICERATVLRDGHMVGTKNCSDLTKESLIEMIVGRTVEELYLKPEIEKGDVCLEVRGLSQPGEFKNINFNVRKGEVLGFSGLMGAGRSEIMRAVFGIDPHTTGEVYVDGSKVKIKSPRDALKCGMAMVTEDRLRLGVIYSMSVLENMTIATLQKICLKIVGFLRKDREYTMFSDMASALGVKYDASQAKIGQLSGGNQQKVIIGRWLLTKPKILFLDEPTRGIDVGAKAEIYRLIAKLAQEGMGIVMVSSELPEILSLCDRIMVVRHGQIVHECARSEATQQTLIRHAFGVS